MRSGPIKMRLNRAINNCLSGKSESTKIGNQTVSPLLLKQAAQGDAAAQHRLGCCYADGTDVGRDDVTACMWFQKAAEAGHVPAMFRLGENWLTTFEKYRNRSANRIRGLFWLLKAANRGSRDACRLLGSCYLNGHGLPARGDLAVKWLKMAANRGCRSSMFQLGFCYRNGNGIERSIVKAFVCFYVASARSSVPVSMRFGQKQMAELASDQIDEVLRLSNSMIQGGPLKF